MFGMKELSTRKLATALLTVSAALVVLGAALSPADGASTSTLLSWLVGALALLGVWAVLLLEVGRRYFGGNVH